MTFKSTQCSIPFGSCSISLLTAALLTIALPASALGDREGPPPPHHLHAAANPDMLPPFLLGILLAEVQQDRIFAITHAAAPALRDAFKTLQKMETEWQTLLLDEKTSDAHLEAFARQMGMQMAQVRLIRLKADRQIIAVLTPDQRRQVEERLAQAGPHRPFATLPEKFAAQQMPQGQAPRRPGEEPRNNPPSIKP